MEGSGKIQVQSGGGLRRAAEGIGGRRRAVEAAEGSRGWRRDAFHKQLVYACLLSGLAVSPSKNGIFGCQMLVPMQHMIMNHAIGDMFYHTVEGYRWRAVEGYRCKVAEGSGGRRRAAEGSREQRRAAESGGRRRRAAEGSGWAVEEYMPQAGIVCMPFV